MPSTDRARLARLLAAEQEQYTADHPRSRALYEAGGNLFGRVPMTWMNKWSGGFPLYLDHARGNRITDVDDHTYVDFALGDTGAMAGHSPAPTAAAVARRMGELGGITTMLPSEDAQWVGEELTRRFTMPLWSFTLSATDANRWAVRLARLATGRSKILVFGYCYHGSVDETFAVPGPDGTTVSRPGNVAPPVPLDMTTRAATWNDLASVERELAHGDVAAILTEPALTNIGIVLPEPGFLEGLRELATKHGALLMIDETHTFSAGWGGATRAWDLQPDIFVIGKSIGGGIPCGAYGISEDVARAVTRHTETGEADIIDVGGVGGTLAGNALSTAAMRATLAEVLTEDAFEHMTSLASAFTEGVQATLDEYDVPWSVSRLGARSEYRFARPAPRSGEEAAAAHDDDIDAYMHLAMVNRGILMTPFHNMALMCPDTTREDVDLHTRTFREVVGALYA
ncbi:aminotransferase class III-fold pyridoxal phosphate-dependent enzyme [Phycicoccus sp. MAQZ13P-2]|uniref:transaminase n=1 Tax=Phycicoccus mangrovi TaxID=2840470 RepID=UPI001C004884|nr:transaminase [Phycicoccus mangrovi]MBT9257860.1 aminotransferase class III-fold pyridoxal phosphate-dependent enzyme [Phycicoccus mangrovi]MBT9272863.1 aminotransferase class III-fold pyridoxal phosphate-dependent enzyme [Phycicoccus mangrovi]